MKDIFPFKSQNIQPPEEIFPMSNQDLLLETVNTVTLSNIEMPDSQTPSSTCSNTTTVNY